MMYKDGRFATHPRFRFFALNTEMRWRALQAGRIYIKQHPQDALLSVEELRDMVGNGSEAFSNRVFHFATSLRGTRPYWFKQRSLIAMVNSLELPTIFFTHSAADTQWPAYEEVKDILPKALMTAISVLISSVCAASDLLARSAPPPPFAVMRGRRSASY